MANVKPAIRKRREKEVCPGNARMRKHPIFGPVTASPFFGGIKDAQMHACTHTLASVCMQVRFMCRNLHRQIPHSTLRFPHFIRERSRSLSILAGRIVLIPVAFRWIQFPVKLWGKGKICHLKAGTFKINKWELFHTLFMKTRAKTKSILHRKLID